MPFKHNRNSCTLRLCFNKNSGLALDYNVDWLFHNCVILYFTWKNYNSLEWPERLHEKWHFTFLELCLTSTCDSLHNMFKWILYALLWNQHCLNSTFSFKVSLRRILGFLKRTATVSLQLESEHLFAFMSLMRGVLQVFL